MKTNTNSLSFTKILDRVIELNDIKSLSNDDLTNILLKIIKTEVSISGVKDIRTLFKSLTTYEPSTNSTGLNIEYDNSFTMDNLLSYNSFDSVLLDIKIPKELIIQSSYFIDSNKIVNLPTLVKRGNNLEPVKYLSFNA